MKSGGKQSKASGEALHYKPSSQAPSTIFFHHLEGGLIPAVQDGAMAVTMAFLVAEWKKEEGGVDSTYSILFASHWPELGHMVA